MAHSSLPFHPGQTWSQKVFSADEIYAQVANALEQAGEKLPTTPRRPDIRLIINNTSGETLEFLNPGDHSGEKQEFIPATGDATAVMVMLKGDSLNEQAANAQKLVDQFDLLSKGLTKDFAHALGTGITSDLVAEAYGPAPFEGQASKLVSLKWNNGNGIIDTIEPVKGDNAAFGARAPTDETVFRSELALFVKGTDTTPELMEMGGMCIAASADWETGEVSTRPIAPSTAQTFYGEHFAHMPVVTLDTEGNVAQIDLGNGKPAIYIEQNKDDSLESQSNQAQDLQDPAPL